MISEVLRINERYLVEVVEAFSFCPWAKSTRLGGGLDRTVLLLGTLDDDALVRTLAEEVESCARQQQTDIALLILPGLAVDSRQFRRLVGRLEGLHAAEHPLGQTPLAMAAFHPEAPYDLSTPPQTVPLVRRSPDPTIQLVRRASITKVRGTEGSGSVFAESLDALLAIEKAATKSDPSDDITQRNWERLSHGQSEQLLAILADIQADRQRSYPPPASILSVP